jgi:glycosyltransferase involved in cell wall biosynthesis
MKIAIYTSGAKYPIEKHGTESVPVQMSLKSCEILTRLGYEVTFITTEAPPDWEIPSLASLRSCRIETVTKATADWPDASIQLLKALKQFRDLRRILRQEGEYDGIHAFGWTRTAWLMGLIRASGISAKCLMSLADYPAYGGSTAIHRFVERRLFPYIDRFLMSTDHAREKLDEAGFGPATVVRHGVTSEYPSAELSSTHLRPEATDMVLFWRNASAANGADVCAEAFKRLSKDYELVDFVFAVRPGAGLDSLLRTLSDQHRNIHLLTYPYADGITIEKLMAAASCVVLPFRKLSVNPQLAVLETILAGAPLITTPVESNRELVEELDTIYFVPPDDVQQVCDGVKYMLENKTKARDIALRAKSQAVDRWNWESYGRELALVYEQLLG